MLEVRHLRRDDRLLVSAYYNEIDPAAAHLLRSLIADGVIAAGDVDTRSIEDVQPDDLRGYAQCHFFAGGGLWSIALRMAGWPDDRPVWTGSCPCQPLSSAGRRKGHADERHLWPAFYRLIAERRPATIFGEQVASLLGLEWFAGVRADLEDAGYACGAADLPAASVGAPHIRQRLYWGGVADGDGAGLGLEPQQHGESIARQDGESWRHAARCGDEARDFDMEHATRQRRREGRAEYELWSGRDAPSGYGAWDSYAWRVGADGKERRVEPAIRLLVDGFPGRVDLLRIAGNAIVPQVAVRFIEQFMMSVAGQPNA
jgi:DNA (cytosine-5)-methyltransferase 1